MLYECRSLDVKIISQYTLYICEKHLRGHNQKSFVPSLRQFLTIVETIIYFRVSSPSILYNYTHTTGVAHRS